MPPTVRERRRRDAIGRIRRFLYGVLLLAATPGAVAADELAHVGKYRSIAVASAPERTLIATLQGLLVAHAELVVSPATPLYAHSGHPRMSLDTVSARVHEGVDAPRFRVAASDGRALRDGIGFDLGVADFGNFHLNLYARRNARTEGQRWAMGAGEDGDGSRRWSLGGTLELVRTLGGERFVAVVPELLLDLPPEGTRFLPFEASLKYANWRSLAEKQSLDERVPQLTFKWRI